MSQLPQINYHFYAQYADSKISPIYIYSYIYIDIYIYIYIQDDRDQEGGILEEAEITHF